MSPEAAVLGLLSAARAVPLAVVYALLRSPRPRRLLGAYVLAGMVVSLGAGTAVIAVFDGSSSSTEATTGRLVIDLLLGSGALVVAVVSRHGRFQRPPRDGTGGTGGVLPGALGRRLRHPTAPAAALAGAATNLPGVFYIAGLVAILETHPTPLGGVLQVLVYNVLRFVVPVLGLVLVLARPDRTASTVSAVHDWGTRHRRDLITAVLGVVGAYLVVKALFGLLG